MENSGKQVVGYYNTLYKLDNKDNLYNILGNEGTSLPDENDTCRSISSGLASLSASQNIPPLEESGVSGEVISAEKPEEDLRDLCDDQIKRALIQFFDNGEKAAQRFKVKVRLNLVDQDNPEFIATLTKDWSNFTKYIPAECKEQIKDTAAALRSQIKAHYNTSPYLGKFHLNQGRAPGVSKSFTQIEPWTIAVIWYDGENSMWRYHLQIQDWTRQGTLSTAHISSNQTKVGVKAQDLYVNPKHETRQRPKTWAEIRAEKRASK